MTHKKQKTVHYLHRLTLVIMLFCWSALSTSAGNVSSDSLMAKAMACLQSNKLSESLTIATDALQQADREQNHPNHEKALLLIGNIYGIFKDYHNAHRYFRMCYDETKETGDMEVQAKSVSNLVMTSVMLGNTADADHFLSLQKELCKDKSDKDRYFLLANEGKVAFLKGDYPKAMLMHRKAYELALSKDLDPSYAASEIGEVASCQECIGEIDDAIESFKEMLRIVEENDDSKGASRCYKCLADLYTKMNDTITASYYNELLTLLNDSVFNEAKFNEARNRLTDIEDNEHRNKITLLNDRIYHQLLVIVAFAVLLIAVIIMAFILRRQNRNLRDAYLSLIEKNREATAMTGMTPTENDDTDNETDNTPLLSEEQKNQLLEAIRQVMSQQDTITDPSFDLPQLCTLVGSNTKYVSWVIKASYHKNFKALLNEYRIRIAAIRLSDKDNYGNFTIQAIAESVGYNSQANFIQAFKRVIGMTPSMYKKIA